MAEHTYPDHAVAIVGMAGRFPDAPNLDAFWANIKGGVESLRTWTDDQLTAAGVAEAARRDPSFVRKGTVLDDVEMFDADFFGVSPGEARVTDPQHRLFLECAWEAMESAGYAPGEGDAVVGVYAGASMNTYLLTHILSNPSAIEAAGGYQLMLGNDKDFLCTRASYKLGLTGPSVTVQTACSTSLVAVETACRAVARGECDMALAGGVSLLFPQTGGYVYQEGMIFSPDGHCRPFDAAAQGTRAGAGAGLVVLKRLKDAQRDGDTIHAVIRGAAVNNDGAEKAGYTAPSVNGQAEVIAMAQALADVEPRSIGYVEAHGTATPLGDPIEIAALTAAFDDGSDAVGYCRIGALKANLGHLDAAAGVAGLIKATLVLKNAEIPPLVNFSAPNPQLDLEHTPFVAQAEGGPWARGDTPLRAAVSSFGIGGTNAHVVLEEAPDAPDAPPRRACQLFVLSARSQDALAQASDNLARRLEAEPALGLADVAWTLQAGRRAFPHRRFVVATSAADAAEALGRRGHRDEHDADTGDRRVAFLFSGQGSQHVGMGARLYESESVYREAVDRCAEILRPHLDADIREAMLGADGSGVNETRLAQPALFVTELALAELWRSWGCEPSAMIGHSIGEYVAAHLAGVMSLEDALKLVAARGRLMQAMAPGSMASVQLPAAKLRSRLGDALEIAAVNAPELTVVSGETDAVEALVKQLEQEGVGCRLLHTSHAFHSRMMEPALDEFRAKVSEVELHEPSIPYVSNVTGDWITAADATSPDYYARHLRAMVQFEPGLKRLASDPALFLLEVGPGTALTALARATLGGEDARTASSLAHPRSGDDDAAAMLTAAGRMWCAGAPLDWPGLHGGDAPPRRVPLPTYPFERQRHWVDFQPKAVAQPDLGPDTPFEVIRRMLFSYQGATHFAAPSWATAPAPPPAQRIDGAWLVLADDGPFSERLREMLTAAGAARVVTAAQGDAFARLGEGRFQIRPGVADDLIQAAASAEAPLAGVIFAWACADPSIAGRTLFDTVIALGVAASESNIAPALRMLIATQGACDVFGEGVAHPQQSLVFGPALTLMLEEPHLRLRFIDLDPDDDEERGRRAAEILAAEACGDWTEVLVAHRNGRRWLRRYGAVELAEPELGAAKLRRNGVYLITGGLGGMGLAIAKRLAELAGARLVLTGRTPLPPRDAWDDAIARGEDMRLVTVLRALQTIEAAGGEVVTEAVDVANADAMRDMIARTRARWGEIHGVVHAAGVAGKGAITILQDPDDVTRTLAPKVAGLDNLVALLGDEPLDFVALMSTISTIRPMPGIAGYAAANAYLDAWAESRGRPKAWSRVVVINWEAWRDVGMAADLSARGEYAASDEDLDRFGIPSSDGVDAFVRALAGGPNQLIVTGHDFQAWFEVARSQAAKERDASDAQAPALPASSDAAGLSASPQAEAPPVSPSVFTTPSQQKVAAIWASLLGVELSGPDDDFFELGGHSLMATQMLTRLHTSTGVRLGLRDVFDSPTIAELAARIDASRTQPPPFEDGDREEFVI